MGELGQMLYGNSTAAINSNQLLSDNEQKPFARDREIGIYVVIFISKLISFKQLQRSLTLIFDLLLVRSW